jgi:hypothetical protein
MLFLHPSNSSKKNGSLDLEGKNRRREYTPVVMGTPLENACLIGFPTLASFF